MNNLFINKKFTSFIFYLSVFFIGFASTLFSIKLMRTSLFTKANINEYEQSKTLLGTYAVGDKITANNRSFTVTSFAKENIPGNNDEILIKTNIKIENNSDLTTEFFSWDVRLFDDNQSKYEEAEIKDEKIVSAADYYNGNIVPGGFLNRNFIWKVNKTLADKMHLVYYSSTLNASIDDFWKNEKVIINLY